MIVKVKSGTNTWSYFEGDNITNHEIDLDNTDQNTPKETVFFLRENTKMNQSENCACGEKHNKGLLLCIQEENKVIARIITNRASYLMNDQGKTVDKLF